MLHPDTDLAQLRDWFTCFQKFVREVDYDAGKAICAPDVLGFGSVANVAYGLDTLVREQWMQIWPNSRDFTYRMDQLKVGSSGNTGWGACTWESTGIFPDGTEFPRSGRVTIVFEKRNEKWLAIHTHYSMFPSERRKKARTQP